MSKLEGAALDYQPAPGNQGQNHPEIATAKPKSGDSESLCVGAGKVAFVGHGEKASFGVSQAGFQKCTIYNNPLNFSSNV